MKKKIEINQLVPGMFVASTNRNWLHLPFFRRKIRSEEIVRKLKAAGVTEVTIDIIKGDDLSPGSESRPVDPFESVDILAGNLAASARVHNEVLGATREMMESVRSGGQINSADADVQVNLLMDQLMEDPQSMLCISVLKNSDEFTFDHCVNSSILALFVGKSMGLNPSDLLHLGKGALLHDIGKCMIPNDILIKPNKLTNEEATIIRTHVEKGVRYLKKTSGMQEEVLRMVEHHHERMDGSGYPGQLMGPEISWLGRVCAILDTYDTMIHENYYKESTDPTEVLKQLSVTVGTHYDEKAFKALADCIGIYPPGTLLMLDSGEMALAYQPNSHNPYRPRVLLLTRVDGSFHTQPVPTALTETVEGQHKYKRSILTAMSLEDTNFNPYEIIGKYSPLMHTENQ